MDGAAGRQAAQGSSPIVDQAKISNVSSSADSSLSSSASSSVSSSAKDPERPECSNFCRPEDGARSDTKPLLGASGKVPSANYYSSFSQLEPENMSDETLLAPTADGYYPHLDVWRAIGIGVVVLDHGNGSYSEWNMLFGQNWTLQYIFAICGICYGLTRRGAGGYTLRLLAYVGVGVTCNLIAYIMVGKPWWRDPWNVVFQFWFVVALIGYSLLLLPLKGYLARCRDRPSLLQAPLSVDAEAAAPTPPPVAQGGIKDLVLGLAKIIIGLLVIFLVLSEYTSRLVQGPVGERLIKQLEKFSGPGLKFWMGDPKQALTSIIAAVELSLSNVWLTVTIPAQFPSQQSATGWAILVNMHFRRLFLFYSGIGEKLMNGLDLMLLGLVCYYLGLRFRRPIGQRMARYWFVWISICGLVWKPGTHGRMDLMMPEEWAMRWRMQFMDTTFMIFFLTAGERSIDPKIFTEDKCNFLNSLGLFLFLVHKAIHIVFPPPWNWLVILSWIPIFMFLYKSSKS